MVFNLLRRKRRVKLVLLGLVAMLCVLFTQPIQDMVINGGTIAKHKGMTLSEDIKSGDIVEGQFERLARLVMGREPHDNTHHERDVEAAENKSEDEIVAGEDENTDDEAEEQLLVADDEGEPPIDVPETFAEAVKSRADSRGMIITPAVIDDGYLDNARNLYVTSIQRLGLTNNTLFICISKAACAEARNKYRLPAVMYKEAKQEESGFFDSGAFVQKAMMKHYIIYDIIQMGYDVLLTDLDLYWFKSPVAELRRSCIDNGRDFVIQSEAGNALNIGFMYVRATKGSLALYKHVTEKANHKGIGGAQSMFNTIVKSPSWAKKIKYGVLSLAHFPDGYSYFEKQKRVIPLANPCKECYICHNNWIVGTIAKTYRFREHLMWHLDDGRYYSDTCKKYLVYENPTGRTPEFTKDEFSAIRSALAIALLTNRTLILPRTFHGKKGTTQFNGVALIQLFDKEFSGRYKESTFLHHPLVPETIKGIEHQCGSFVIMNAFNKAAKAKQPKIYDAKKFKKVFTPAAEGASQDEIHDWFMTDEMQKCSVIRFHNLYHAFNGFNDKEENYAFNMKMSRGLVPGAYRQLALLKMKKT